MKWYLKSVEDVDVYCCNPKMGKNEYLISFGKRVKELRKQQGLSQENLALICDLDRSYIGGVERGERNISLINLFKIAKALDISLSDLFIGL